MFEFFKRAILKFGRALLFSQGHLLNKTLFRCFYKQQIREHFKIFAVRPAALPFCRSGAGLPRHKWLKTHGIMPRQSGRPARERPSGRTADRLNGRAAERQSGRPTGKNFETLPKKLKMHILLRHKKYDNSHYWINLCNSR